MKTNGKKKVSPAGSWTLVYREPNQETWGLRSGYTNRYTTEELPKLKFTFKIKLL